MKTFNSIVFFLIVVGSATSFFVTTPECGDDFYTRTGTFSSPTYNAPSDSTNDTEQCEWRITGSSDEKIVLNITDIDIVKTPGCTEGFIEVRDGYWDISPLLKRECGQGRLDPITSTGNKMYISYQYNNPDGHKGFTADFEGICGSDLFVENITQFSTPNYPDPYPLDKKCIWRIVVPDNRLAVLTFNTFDVEYESDCLYDNVEIRDGLDENGRLIGVYCSSGLRQASVPTQIISNSSYLYVKFVSDISVQKGGFLATVENDYDECSMKEDECAQICINTVGSYRCACRPDYALDPNGKDCYVSCGGILNDTSGSIHSPLYPDVYPANQTCTWDIITEPNYLVKINFTYFDIEDGSTNDTETQCDKDKLEIYNRNITNNNLSLQGTYCGEEIPEPITSLSNALTLVFQSDLIVQKTGFLLNYTTGVDFCSINNGNCFRECDIGDEGALCQCLDGYTPQNNNRDCAKDECYFDISSPTGQVKSTNYPNAYLNYQSCEWSFRTTPGHRLQVVFSAFLIENATNCVYDNLTFYDGLTTSDTQLGKFCGNVIPPPVVSTSNELYMVFQSDQSNVYSGFLATYSSLCGEELQAINENKYIFSHADYGYSNYENNVSCRWTISAESGNVVNLSFSNFNLEDNCQNDYVEILDGSSSNSTSIEVFCGSTVPSNVLSTSNAVTVLFVTDGTITDRGFRLEYKAVSNRT